MFHMMNEARIGVGSGAMALGYTGYLKSLQYAKERPQGRPITAKDPTTPQVPIVQHADVKRMLLAQKSYVEGALALVLYCGRLLDDERTAEEKTAEDLAAIDDRRDDGDPVCSAGLSALLFSYQKIYLPRTSLVTREDGKVNGAARPRARLLGRLDTELLLPGGAEVG